MNDVISDMLNRIYVCSRQGGRTVTVPSSRKTEAVASILSREGYIASYAKKGKKTRKYIEVEIKYLPLRGLGGKAVDRPAIDGFQRVSKPSRRVYVSAKDITPVFGGRGMGVISTSQGVLVDREARAKGVGGELLFKVW